MIDLSIQIKLIISSFIFGVFFAISFKLCHKLLYGFKTVVNIIDTFLFLGIMSFIYFWMIEYVSDGIFHVYSLLSVLVGFYLFAIIANKIKK